MAPVAARVHIAEFKHVLLARLDLGDGNRNLPGHEFGAASFRFVVEQDARAGEHAIAFAVVLGNPVAVQLGNTIGATRVEGRIFVLRNRLDLAEHLAGRGLVNACVGLAESDGFQELGHADGVDVGGRKRGFPRGGHEGLCCQIVDFVGFCDFHGTDEGRRVRHVAENKGDFALEVFGVVEVQLALATDQPENLVAFRKKKFGQVGTILPGNTCNKCSFHMLKNTIFQL